MKIVLGGTVTAVLVLSLFIYVFLLTILILGLPVDRVIVGVRTVLGLIDNHISKDGLIVGVCMGGLICVCDGMSHFYCYCLI